MYRVLCYGDSNTWGFNPATGIRLSENERWPGVLRVNLGDGFEIIEDGQNGRSIQGSDTSHKDSLLHYGPLDVVVIFLGINDICFNKEISLENLVFSMDDLVEMLSSTAAGPEAVRPEIILLSSVPINQTQATGGLYELEAEKILRFGEELRKLAVRCGCGFIDSGRIVHSSELDGIHLEAPEHRKLGLFIADYIRSFLKNSNLVNGK